MENMHTMTTAPKVGDTITTRAGKLATIIKVHPLGTIDIQVNDTGDCFRMTGLQFSTGATVLAEPIKARTRAVRVKVECQECGKKFSVSANACDVECPKCGGVDYEVR